MKTQLWIEDTDRDILKQHAEYKGVTMKDLIHKYAQKLKKSSPAFQQNARAAGSSNAGTLESEEAAQSLANDLEDFQ